MPRKPRTAAAKNRRRIKRVAPTAKNQKKQILSTQNQIVAIKQHLNLNKERIRWHCGFTLASMNPTSGVTVIPLTSGPGQASGHAVMNNVLGTSCKWTPTMTAAPQLEPLIRSKAIVNKQYVDLTITAGSEKSLVQYTAFVVQLHNKTAVDVYKNTSSMTTLLRGTDYITPLTFTGGDSGYGAYLNAARFKILKRIEFETAGTPPLGYSNNPGSSTGDTGRGTRGWYVRRAQFRLNYGSTVCKSTTNLNELSYDELDPEHKRFIVIFSDNSIADLEYPTVSMSSLVTGYTAE